MNLQQTLIVFFFLVGSQVNSSRQFENMWTIPYFGCNISFVWFSVQRIDSQVLSLFSHIQTCQEEIPESGFTVVDFNTVDVYFQRSNSDQTQVSRYFYLRDTILHQNILVVWLPSSRSVGSEASLQLKLINPFRQDLIYKPQHILCYRKTCPSAESITTPRYQFDSMEPEFNNAGPSVEVFHVDSNTIFGWTDLFLYKVLCKVTGALVFFMLGVICVLGLLYRKAVQDRKNIHKQLQQALSFPKPKPPPVFGNISRRRDRAIYQNQEQFMDTKVALLNPDTCSLIHMTPRSSFTMGSA